MAPGRHGEAAHRQSRQVVDSVDLVHREPLEQAIFDHRPGSGAALFGRLEHENDGAGKIAIGREMAGGGEERRRMAVVAAGMHARRASGRPREPR